MPSMGKAGEKQKATLLHWLALLGYKLLCAILRCTDVRIVALLGRAVGYLVWAIFPFRRRVVARNLRIVAGPMLRPGKLRPMVRRNIVRTVMNLACSLKTGMMTEREASRAIRMEGAGLFERSGMGGHTVIACIPHAGNWEALARIRPHFKGVEHFGSMYRRMSNPLLEKLVYRSRTRYGCEMFSKEEGLKAVLRLARTGGLLGILSDQFTQEGLHLPYFGKITGVTPLPALLYKRCKGKGRLFSVFTRNTGLGKWDAILGRPIDVPEGENSLADLTMSVNHALEQCQKEDILDGFWMHHRWKSTAQFAPEQDADTQALASRSFRLPFRAIVALPEPFEEAAILVPFLRILKASRTDMQLTVICPGCQKNWWASLPEITNIVTSDGATPPVEQLEADALYKDGPYDYLFLFSRNKRVWKHLERLMPIYLAGFDHHPLARRFKTKYTERHPGPPQHRLHDYTYALHHCHGLKIDAPGLSDAIGGNPDAHGDFIAPFSSLGDADCWPEGKWAELCHRLGHATLLALPGDEDRAQAMATRLNLPCLILPPEKLAQHLGPHTHLYAVDGLLPLLASYTDCRCTVIMASRLIERYGLIGSGHRHINNHVPCHPCYASHCDMEECCTASISVDAVLGQPPFPPTT